MRYLLYIFVALALAWQSTSMASLSAAPGCIAAKDGNQADPGAGTEQTPGEEDEEPECD